MWDRHRLWKGGLSKGGLTLLSSWYAGFVVVVLFLGVKRAGIEYYSEDT